MRVDDDHRRLVVGEPGYYTQALRILPPGGSSGCPVEFLLELGVAGEEGLARSAGGGGEDAEEPVPEQLQQEPGDPDGEAFLVGGLVAVDPAAEEEQAQSEAHGDEGEAEAEDPAEVILDVVEDEEGGEDAHADAEVPPVEEGALALALVGVTAVELVGAEGLDAGLVPPVRHRHHVQGGEEEEDLRLRRRRAEPRVPLQRGAVRRPERGKARREGQHEQALQLRRTREARLKWASRH